MAKAIIMTDRQQQVVDELKNIGIRVSKVDSLEVLKSDNLIIPSSDKKGNINLRLRSKSRAKISRFYGTK